MVPGHLIFTILELPHPKFTREKNDLHTTVQVTLKEALLGFEKELKHLDDHIVPIIKEGVSQPGDIIKIRGEGMPIHQSSERGDLFVKIEIVFPTELSEKQKESNNIFIFSCQTFI
jgi:DnaJ family protein B protein 11